VSYAGRRLAAVALAGMLALAGVGWVAVAGSLARTTALGFSAAWSQPAAGEGSAKPATAKPAAEEDEEEQVLVEADDARYDGQRKVWFLKRNVRIRHKDTELFSDWAEYHEDTDSAIARGNLLLRDPESTVTGDVINLDFTDETAVVDGHVVIVTQKKKSDEKGEGQKAGPQPPPAQGQPAGASAEGTPPGGETAPAKASSEQPQAGEEKGRPESIKEIRERKTTIRCTKLRYHYTDGERYAWLTGPVQAEQKERMAWADRAEYDGEDGILKLAGNVRVKTSEGDEFQCPAAVVSVEDEWLRAEKVSGFAIRRKKAKEKEETPSPPEAQPPEATPTPPSG